MKNETCNLTSNLYSPRFEHDACGIGAVVDTQGRPSHETVDRALKIVEKLEHRAGKDASGETGDGVGILVQISHRFFSAVLAELGVTVGQARSYAVGMFFLPQDRILRARRQKLFEILAEKAGLPVLLWRACAGGTGDLRPAGGGLYAQHLAADLGPPGRRRERPGI